MQLRLVRSQREAGVVSKAIVFCLDARVQLTPDEQANVNRYRLGNEVIYNSEASRRHLGAHQAALASGTVGGVAKSFVSLAMVAINLNITINGLQRGQHIECKSLDELRSAEDALIQACKTLWKYLETASTFDGREVLVGFPDGEPTIISSTPPPMLVASGTVPLGPSAEFHPAEQMAPVPGPVCPPAPDYPPPANPFDTAWERVKRFWLSATGKQKVVIVVVGFVVLILLLRACS